MKKSAVRNSLVVVAIVAIFMTMIALVSHYSMPVSSMPSFNFLGDRKPAYHTMNNSQTQKRITQDIYSFEANFDDIFLDANKELLTLGFVDKTHSGSELWHRDYSFLNGPYEQIRVRIYTRHKLSVYSSPKSSDYSSPDRHEFHLRDGWISVTVSVEVVPWRIRFYSWLSRIL
jgi:hypothetical protein